MRAMTSAALTLALLGLSACNLPPRSASLDHSGYGEPSTGSRIAGGPEPERIGNNPDPSMAQEGFGFGSAGSAH